MVRIVRPVTDLCGDKHARCVEVNLEMERCSAVFIEGLPPSTSAVRLVAEGVGPDNVNFDVILDDHACLQGLLDLTFAEASDVPDRRTRWFRDRYHVYKLFSGGRWDPARDLCRGGCAVLLGLSACV